MTKEVRLNESLANQPAKLRHDALKGLVFGVKLVSFGESFHKRVYDKSCGADANKFHGAKANVDHQENPINAPFDARFGRFFNPTTKNDGIYGDFKYNPKHKFAEQFGWWVDNDPTAVGFSVNALAKTSGMRDGKMVVTGFTKVDSVDLVGDPALTKGVFESKMDQEQEPATPNDEPPDDNAPNEPEDTGPTMFDEALAKLAEAAVLETAVGNNSDKARKVRAIADLLDDMEGGEDQEEDDSDDGETPDENPDEEPMKESKDQNQTDEKVAALEKLVAELKAENAEVRARESKAAEYVKRKSTVKQKCVEAKLDNKLVTETFIEVLASQDNDEVVTRLIEDRREVANIGKPQNEEVIGGGKASIKPVTDESLEKGLLGIK